MRITISVVSFLAGAYCLFATVDHLVLIPRWGSNPDHPFFNRINSYVLEVFHDRGNIVTRGLGYLVLSLMFFLIGTLALMID